MSAIWIALALVSIGFGAGLWVGLNSKRRPVRIVYLDSSLYP